MYSKKNIKSFSLVAALVIGVVIVSAQVHRQTVEQKQLTAISVAGDDTTNKIIAPDNTAGLAELDKIINRYKNANLLLRGEINYYENTDSVVSLQEHALFTSVNTTSASSYEIDSVQTIVQDGMTLFIDKKEKTMSLIAAETAPADAAVKKDIAAELSQFTGYIYSISVETSGVNKKLVIGFKDDVPFNIDSYEIVYNPENYRVMRVRMEMTDGDINPMPGDDTGEVKRDNELVFVDSASNEVPTGYYADLRTNVYEIVYSSEISVAPGIVDIGKFIRKNASDEYAPAGPYKHFELLN